MMPIKINKSFHDYLLGFIFVTEEVFKEFDGPVEKYIRIFIVMTL